MKKLIVLAIAICMSGAAYAGCGTKIPVKGKLSSFDAEKKELTITVKAGEQKVTLEATATIKDAKGEDAKIEDLVGKRIEVSTDKHTKKGESVAAAAPKEKKEKAEKKEA